MAVSTRPSGGLATRPAAPPPAAAAGLPPVGVEPQVTRWGPVALGGALVVAAEVMAIGALLGAFLLFRSQSRPWLPKDVTLDNYRGTTILLSALLASLAVQWAVRSARSDDQRNLGVSLAMAFGLALATANLLWFTIARVGFGAGATPYGLLFFSLLGSYLALAFGGTVLLLVVLIRGIGGQFSRADHQGVTAAAVHTHGLTALWVLIFLVVWVLK